MNEQRNNYKGQFNLPYSLSVMKYKKRVNILINTCDIM